MVLGTLGAKVDEITTDCLMGGCAAPFSSVVSQLGNVEKGGKMPRYTIKMNVVIMGLDTVVIDTPEEYEVGQTVSVSPTSGMTIRDKNGSAVDLSPGVSISGTIIAKE